MDFKLMIDDDYKKELTSDLIEDMNNELSISRPKKKMSIMIDDQFCNRSDDFKYHLNCDMPFNLKCGTMPNHISVDNIISQLACNFKQEENGNLAIENMLVVIRCKSTDTILHSYFVKTGLLVVPLKYNILIDYYIVPKDLVPEIKKFSSYQFELETLAKNIIGEKYEADTLTLDIINNVQKHIKYSDKIRCSIAKKKLEIQDQLMMYAEKLDIEDLPLQNTDSSEITLYCMNELLRTSIRHTNIKLREHNLVVIRCKTTNKVLHYYYQDATGKTIQFNKFNLKIDYYEVPERYLIYVKYFKDSYETVMESLTKKIVGLFQIIENPYIQKVISIADNLLDYITIETHFKAAIMSGNTEFIINDISRDTLIRFFRSNNIKPVITHSIDNHIYVNKIKILL